MISKSQTKRDSKMTKIYQINDRTMKYLTLIQTKHQHEYFGLPGEFEARYPQEIVFPNMEAGRADELYSTKENMMIDFEEESGHINDTTLMKISNYVIFADFMYSKRLYVAILTHRNPANFPKYFKRSPSIIIKIHYYYLSQEDLWEKYENLINKIGQKIELTDKESLDIAFVSKFIYKEYGQYVTQSLAKLFKFAKIADKKLKRDVCVILGAQIVKHFENSEKTIELMEEIGMKQIEDEIRIIAREEYKEDYQKIEAEKQKLEQENTKTRKELEKYQKGIQQLKRCLI